jgi:uncharacterized protein
MRAVARGVLPRILLAVLLLTALPWAAAEVAVPPLKARVTDLTGTLTADQVAGLEARLARLEGRRGSQVAVLIVPTTRPESIEQYSIRVVEQWKLGRAQVDDGVLLLVAKDDRKLRIEVGRGLEGAIPDAYARRIIDEGITPRFKRGEFHEGITVGLDRIVRLVDGESLPPPAAKPLVEESDWDAEWIFYGFVALLWFAGFLQALMGRLLGAAAGAAAAGTLVYFLSGIGLALVAGIIVFIISLLLGGSSRGGSWSSGGGYSGGGGGGGGFSGGGGSFGGGGSSGSW